MMSSGTISVFIGMLPEMKTTDPYSPRARANARAKPVRSAGTSSARITLVIVCHRLAHRLAAASSISGPSSASTGGKRRTETQPVRRQDARRSDGLDELMPAHPGRLDERGRQRYQHDQAEIRQRKSERNAEARKNRALFTGGHGCGLLLAVYL